MTGSIDTKPRQRITSADRNPISIEYRIGLQTFQAHDHVMMFAVISEHVASRSQGPPGNRMLLKIMDQRGRLFFTVWREYPIYGSADAQTR